MPFYRTTDLSVAKKVGITKPGFVLTRTYPGAYGESAFLKDVRSRHVCLPRQAAHPWLMHEAYGRHRRCSAWQYSVVAFAPPYRLNRPSVSAPSLPAHICAEAADVRV